MSNEAMIWQLRRAGVLKSPRIAAAFEAIDRRDFVREAYRDQAYLNHPLDIGYGQTISQPYVVAFGIELLGPIKNHHVLDVGSGSGYTGAILGKIVGPGGSVLGIDRIPELVEFGRENLAKYDLPNVRIELAKEDGALREGPFHRILVSAEADEATAEQLLQQLHPSGKLVIPINGSIWCYTNTRPRKADEYRNFRFVPFISDYEEAA